jgi:uncharacterized protein (DUF885 family)
MLDQVRAVSPGSLSEIWQVRREVVLDMLEQRLLGEPFDISHVGVPYRISQQGGAYFGVPDFLDSTHPVENAADAEAYLDRLARFSVALDDQSDAQRVDAARGYAAPAWSLEIADNQIGALLAGPAADSGMVTSLVRRAGEKGISGDWSGRAAAIVDQAVRPALQRQLELIESLLPDTRAGDGVWRVPRGDEIYHQALRYFTTTQLSADEIHRTGLEQVAEISGELDVLLRGVGLSQGPVGDRLTALNSRPEQVFPNDDAGRAALIASLNESVEAMQQRLPLAFATIPDPAARDPPGSGRDPGRRPERLLLWRFARWLAAGDLLDQPQGHGEPAEIHAPGADLS